MHKIILRCLREGKIYETICYKYSIMSLARLDSSLTVDKFLLSQKKQDNITYMTLTINHLKSFLF